MRRTRSAREWSGGPVAFGTDRSGQRCFGDGTLVSILLPRQWTRITLCWPSLGGL